ncbi:hypothetical protein [Fischerella thermalis]|jgi:hypothetical protein|uniref:Uncharacterized protein n=2 Tax=Fischerella thermalis TaxID=372787 RepID=G6FQB9_9CYAN|nr:hypothetical protein [Fischerella thermalis]EHC18004.1 hypothetical protein FJSC11DRAFT_1066 [Fischerella thermalis JSC-11]PLZ16863.1 hypothetical protein CBP29_21955 [Fischerella thermalis WC341]PLZ31211.1 hypothetical protein CBP28_06835 [Fischerella thermalis WC559]PLZ33383.1 hypothetical protein CBP10_08085 [Fischerella thermalis WC558]PLZ38620.1 hypothetical protein CBP27_09285 [Fischerella thermalis WC542]
MSRQIYHQRKFLRAFDQRVINIIYKLITILKICWMRLLESVPFLIACAVFLSVISLKSPILLFCLVFSSLSAVVLHKIGQQVNLPKRYIILLQMLGVAIIFSAFWLDYFADPAQAQFFRKAEDFFKNTLTQGAATGSNTQAAVSLVFNVLRALYLLYIAVSLIGVINAVRKDEDWQSVARIPLLVVVAVTIADVLTGFVIGDTNTTN